MYAIKINEVEYQKITGKPFDNRNEAGELLAFVGPDPWISSYSTIDDATTWETAEEIPKKTYGLKKYENIVKIGNCVIEVLPNEVT